MGQTECKKKWKKIFWCNESVGEKINVDSKYDII